MHTMKNRCGILTVFARLSAKERFTRAIVVLSGIVFTARSVIPARVTGTFFYTHAYIYAIWLQKRAIIYFGYSSVKWSPIFNKLITAKWRV